jgi:uncharacterized protein (TIGR03437 family)
MRIMGSNPHYIGVSTRSVALWLLGPILSAAAIPPYVVQTVAGSDFMGDGGAATKALLATVQGVAADALGNYYLADTDAHTVRRISPKGTITTIAGTGKPGFSGDGGPATLAQLNLPYGVAADLTGNVYVADFGNHCVRKISPAGVISTVAGLTADSQMSGPRNIAVDTLGTLYISDFIASRVYRLTPQGVFTAYAGSPYAVALGDNGPATLARLNNPAGLAIDLSGNLYIADSGNKRIRKVSSGLITSINASVSTPVGLAVDFASNLYVADAGAGTFVRIANPNSAKPAVTSWPESCRDVAVDYSGNVVLANADTVFLFNGSIFAVIAGGNNFLFAGDESSGISARMNRPLGLVRDPAGNLYIADSANGRIRRLTTDGVIHTFLSGLTTPSGLAFDGNTGNLYIADAGTHAVLVSATDGSLTVLAGGHGEGFAGDGGPAISAKLNAPSAVAFNSSRGVLYVSDTGNNCVRMITPDGRIETLAMLDSPAGLAIGPTGELYAAESGGGRVVRIESSGIVDSISTAGVWLNPQGLAFDPSGVLYVTDTGGERITRVDPDGTVTLAAGNGAQGFSGDGGLGLLATFDTPSALVADAAGNIYVSDTGNNRVRMLTPFTASAGALSTAPPPQLVTLVNAASGLGGAVAAGELVTLIGTGVDTYDIQINSVQVAPVATSVGQATVELPDDLDVSGTVEIQLLSNGVPQARVTAPVVQVAPGVYPGLIANSDGSLNSSMNPAARGSAITIYGTGEGRTGANITAALDGQAMDIASFGPSPDTAGMFVLTAYVPSGYFPAGAKSLIVSAGLIASQSGVVINVR